MPDQLKSPWARQRCWWIIRDPKRICKSLNWKTEHLIITLRSCCSSLSEKFLQIQGIFEAANCTRFWAGNEIPCRKLHQSLSLTPSWWKFLCVTKSKQLPSSTLLHPPLCYLGNKTGLFLQKDILDRNPNISTENILFGRLTTSPVPPVFST